MGYIQMYIDYKSIYNGIINRIPKIKYWSQSISFVIHFLAHPLTVRSFVPGYHPTSSSPECNKSPVPSAYSSRHKLSSSTRDDTKKKNKRKMFRIGKWFMFGWPGAHSPVVLSSVLFLSGHRIVPREWPEEEYKWMATRPLVLVVGPAASQPTTATE